MVKRMRMKEEGRRWLDARILFLYITILPNILGEFGLCQIDRNCTA